MAEERKKERWNEFELKHTQFTCCVQAIDNIKCCTAQSRSLFCFFVAAVLTDGERRNFASKS